MENLPDVSSLSARPQSFLVCDALSNNKQFVIHKVVAWHIGKYALTTLKICIGTFENTL